MNNKFLNYLIEILDIKQCKIKIAYYLINIIFLT